MLPFGIGFGEIIAILLVLVIFVGPEGIPQAIRAIVKVIKSVRTFVDEVRHSAEFDEVKREILDPLDEARRFNPQARTRDWVRRELEEPISDTLKDDPVGDFHHADHDHHAPSDHHEPHDAPHTHYLHELHGDHGDHGAHDGHNDAYTNQGHKDHHDHEDDDSYDEGTLGAISTLDPLERGLHHSSTTAQDATQDVTQDITQDEIQDHAQSAVSELSPDPSPDQPLP